VILDWYWQEPERWYAYDWCETHQIEPLIYTVTPETESVFLEKILKYAFQNKTPAKIGYIPVILTEIIGQGKLITGFGEPFYNSTYYAEPHGNYFEVAEHDYYLDLTLGQNHPGGFLNYTPELFFSLIKHLPTDKNTQHAKAQIYGLPFRPKFNNVNVLPWGKYQNFRDKLEKPLEKTVKYYTKSELLNLL
jgi:hypothetical protein